MFILTQHRTYILFNAQLFANSVEATIPSTTSTTTTTTTTTMTTTTATGPNYFNIKIFFFLSKWDAQKKKGQKKDKWKNGRGNEKETSESKTHVRCSDGRKKERERETRSHTLQLTKLYWFGKLTQFLGPKVHLCYELCLKSKDIFLELGGAEGKEGLKCAIYIWKSYFWHLIKSYKVGWLEFLMATLERI